MYEWSFLVFIGAVTYFYFNWHLLNLADECFDKKRKLGRVFLIFVINYTLFTVCSMLQLHLVVNWTLFFLALLIELQFGYGKGKLAKSCIALMGVMAGLAANVVLRCIFSIALNKPLAVFDNKVELAGNMKRYPVYLGFLLAGLMLSYLRRKNWGRRYNEFIQDMQSLRFLVSVMLVLYFFLVLNLFTYYTDGNHVVMKLWGIKSAAFAEIGLYLAVSYSFRMSRLNRYREKNRQQRQELIREWKEEEKIRLIAYVDTLTNCYNRQYVEEVLDTDWKSGKSFAVCFADLNCLKTVNDQFGHVAGDQYLIAVADALRRNIRNDDYLFRYGGDEFLVVFENMDIAIIRERMERVNKELETMSLELSRPGTMSISWGTASCEEAESVESLLVLADSRMYESKKKLKMK